MKDSRNKIIRPKLAQFIAVMFLFSASMVLPGCTILGKIGGGVYDIVTWPPRKLWSVTGDKWLGVHNEQQTDLGPRRSPAGNPNGGGMGLGVPSGYPSMPQGMEGYPIQQGGYPSSPYPAQGSMPAMPGYEGSAGGYPAVNPYGIPQQQGGGYPSTASSMPPIPMPPMPAQGSMQPPYGYQDMPSGMMGDGMPGMDADAAYRRAGSGGGGGAVAAPKKKWWSWIPLTSSNYKAERVYEPMSAEFVVDAENEDYVEVDGTPWKGNEAEVNRRRSASMFPLEEYAPKSDVVVQSGLNANQLSTYPKLGNVPQRPQNVTDVDAAAAELDAMMKESEDAQAKQTEIHGLSIDSPVSGKGALPPKMERALNDGLIIPSDNALKNDADVMKQVPNIIQNQNEERGVRQEKKKGFFSRLFHRAPEKQPPRMVTRKSMPPIVRKPDTVPNPYVEAPIQMLEPSAGGYPKLGTRPLPQAAIETFDYEDNSRKNVNSQGTHLPESRYSGRRKVPQTDE